MVLLVNCFSVNLEGNNFHIVAKGHEQICRFHPRQNCLICLTLLRVPLQGKQSRLHAVCLQNQPFQGIFHNFCAQNMLYQLVLQSFPLHRLVYRLTTGFRHRQT